MPPLSNIDQMPPRQIEFLHRRCSLKSINTASLLPVMTTLLVNDSPHCPFCPMPPNWNNPAHNYQAYHILYLDKQPNTKLLCFEKKDPLGENWTLTLSYCPHLCFENILIKQRWEDVGWGQNGTLLKTQLVATESFQLSNIQTLAASVHSVPINP